MYIQGYITLSTQTKYNGIVFSMIWNIPYMCVGVKGLWIKLHVTVHNTVQE